MSTSATSDITGKEQSYHVDQQDKAWCPVAQGQEVLKIVVFSERPGEMSVKLGPQS